MHLRARFVWRRDGHEEERHRSRRSGARHLGQGPAHADLAYVLRVALVARMPRSEGQVQALDALAGQRVDDPESLQALARLFAVARSVQVQRAIAGVLIRADYRMLARNDLARSLRQSRLRSPDGQDVIDALIRRLQVP